MKKKDLKLRIKQLESEKSTYRLLRMQYENDIRTLIHEPDSAEAKTVRMKWVIMSDMEKDIWFGSPTESVRTGMGFINQMQSQQQYEQMPPAEEFRIKEHVKTFSETQSEQKPTIKEYGTPDPVMHPNTDYWRFWTDKMFEGEKEPWVEKIHDIEL